MALALYVLAIIGFSGGNIFYDSLLVNVAARDRLDRVSALGFAFGYLGGGLLFAINVLMTLYPALFGVDNSADAVRISFVSVAIWWAVFSVPLLLFVKEPKTGAAAGWGRALGEGIAQLGHTFRQLRRLRVTFLFLLAYWLYIDGVDTIVRMAVDYGLALGFEANALMLALLITQFVGFPAAIAFGHVGQRFGPKRGILVAILVYLFVILWASGMREVWEFYGLAVTIGLVQGGIQALSRSLYARLIPRDQAGEFFGFYNMLGKFAVVLGPVLMGWAGMLTGSSRLAILSVTVLFVAGAVLLAMVDVSDGERAARSLESA
jgi:UMF1 family MFS transporter